MWIGAVAGERGLEELAEPIERRQRRVAERRLDVRLDPDDPASWTCEPHHLGQRLEWFGEVDQQRASVHEVERAGLDPGVARVRENQLDVIQPPAGDELRRHRDMRRVGIQPDHQPAR